MTFDMTTYSKFKWLIRLQHRTSAMAIHRREESIDFQKCPKSKSKPMLGNTYLFSDAKGGVLCTQPAGRASPTYRVFLVHHFVQFLRNAFNLLGLHHFAQILLQTPAFWVNLPFPLKANATSPCLPCLLYPPNLVEFLLRLSVKSTRVWEL